jgi:hypothetical protein
MISAGKNDREHGDHVPAAGRGDWANPGGRVDRSRQAMAFASLVAHADRADLHRILAPMSVGQLRALAVALALQLNAASRTSPVAAAGPDAVCAFAVDEAATALGASRDAILGEDRRRSVTDARAVAMAAARRFGLTLPSIAHHFGKNHTSVIYAKDKVSKNPRLDVVADAILNRLHEEFAGSVGPLSRSGTAVPGRGATLLPSAARVSAGQSHGTDERRHADVYARGRDLRPVER